jgi:type II secretory pathway component PulJ
MNMGNRGQTLIETILYVLILGLIIIVTTTILVDLISTQNKITTIANSNDTVRISMKTMTQSIEDAYQVLTPNPTNTTTNKLVIQTDAGGNKVTYYSSGGTIYSQNNTNTPTQISSSNIYTYNISFKEEANTGLSPTVFITITESNVGTSGIITKKTYETTATQRRQ